MSKRIRKISNSKNPKITVDGEKVVLTVYSQIDDKQNLVALITPWTKEYSKENLWSAESKREMVLFTGNFNIDDFQAGDVELVPLGHTFEFLSNIVN